MPIKEFPINDKPAIPKGMRMRCKSCAYCGKKESISFGKNDLIYSHNTPIPADIKEKAQKYEATDYICRARFFEYTGEVSVKTFQYGAFCTLRCAENFANSAYKAGYRVEN